MRQLLRAALAALLQQQRPAEPLLWLAQYFLMRCGRAKTVHFVDRPRWAAAVARGGGHRDGDGSAAAAADHNDGDDDHARYRVRGQALKFAINATVVLFGSLEGRMWDRGDDSAGGAAATPQAGGQPGAASRAEDSPAPQQAACSPEALTASMSAATTGLLLCRPANVCAWLAVEFCRQSPCVEMVSWDGRVVDTATGSEYIDEESSKHRVKERTHPSKQAFENAFDMDRDGRL